MWTKRNNRLSTTECLLLIFAGIFFSYGSCQNAEPRGSSRSAKTLQGETPYHRHEVVSNQRSDLSRWDGSREIGKNLVDDLGEPSSSLTDTGNSEVQTAAPEIHESGVDNKNKGASELKNLDDESTRKTSLTTVSTRCSSKRGLKRRLCVLESRMKKRRRYTSSGRSSSNDDTELSPSNRIRGSSSRSKKVQDRGQSRSKNRGRKRNGKRTRKQENNGKTRSRKNNKMAAGISPEAPAALHRATDERVENSTTRTAIGFSGKETLSNRTIFRVEQKTNNDSRNTRISEEASEILRNFDAENTKAPSITVKPEATDERREGAVNNDFSKNIEKSAQGRKRHEDNVEHEFSKNLEKEILWSRTELPEVFDETLGGQKINRSSSIFNPEMSKPTFVDSFEAVKNARFDAAKMLGYSRSAEDIPIMELENEVLARTLEDYNAYLKNGGKTSQLLRHSSEKETSSEEHAGDEASLPVRRPTYKHEVTEESEDERKLEQQREHQQPEVSEELVNKETGDGLKGDLSCINGTFIPAPLARHALIKYVKSSIPGHEYLEADYECTPGFYLASSNSRLLCKNRRWIGVLPNCKIRRGHPGPCAESSCDQVCNEVDGRAKCSCYKGFRLDGHKCYDINECESDNGGCEHKCINTPGSYKCECPQGMKQGEDKFSCMDVNECLLNNGHGPCQDTCRNHEGSYVCSCEGLSGTVLSSDNHTCQDAGPCAVNNAGCSHTCLSTMGRVFCLCPDGFMLADDWKTCQDIDECSVPDLQTEICHYGCINTPGSYRCVDPTELSDQPIQDSITVTCFKGYQLTAESSCIDINECATNNGGCNEVCENTEGSFFCACDGDEKALSADGKSCIDINNLACPPLDPARRGYLMCSREATPRMWRDGRREANRPGTKCYLKCPLGYQLHGEYELTCQGDGTWDGPKHGECVKYSKPRLECPNDVVAEIPPDRDEAFVTFDQPSTDLDWFRYVRSKPSWGTRLEASLKPGLHLVTFFARHPVSKKQASCVLRIIVKEGEAPKVNNCPSDVEGKNGTSFTWMEPEFTDNVRVTHTSNNESPGKAFGVGEWKIVYEASDEAGWTTRCVFNVVVHQD